MGFITDLEASEIAKRILPAEDYEDFAYQRDMFRHLEDCLATNTPSPHCKHTDVEENLAWCRVGLKTHELGFEHYLQEIILHQVSQKVSQ